MMYFSAHYSDRDPAYFMAVDWNQAATLGAGQGTMITLYWLADDADRIPPVHEEAEATV